MGRHVVGRVSDVPPGQRKIVEAEGRSIGIFNVNGTYHALRNACPHQGGPLCLGSIKGMTLPSAPGEYLWARDGEILRCPWHGWEFDLLTGRAICEPERTRVRTYEVTLESVETENDVVNDAAELLSQEGHSTPQNPPTEVEKFPVTVEEEQIVLHL